MTYCELQVTTHFSFLRGVSSAEELFATASEMGIPALGITDPSGRRLIRKLAEAGLAVPDGSTQPYHKGRPTRLHRLAIASALAAGEPARVFAPVEKGDLVLDEGGHPGELTRGDFSLSFQKGEGYGAGRTLSGRFSALALDAGFGPEPVVGAFP